ncbi:hypothetical protein Riv7116_1674 [Rivularia sp. PCC 7116]|uniref:PEP-CTERM domain protein n=1 Tax=Rivularia sp. PCC 7116 TaxID=373994 RepID=UPI00029F1630|nr:PEP-CTERM domain protein [Rivularia sp. PCC 7116]AFY54223.1 hypothetical protein Riv7116_1674 [Rivularia sp. PCC 7116]
MKTNIKLISILTWASLIFSTPAKAFDSDFNSPSWEKSGDVSVVNPNQVNLSTDGLFYDDFDLGADNGDFNFSGNPAAMVGFGGLEDFLDIDASVLDVGGYAYEGSAIKQTINVKTGDVLTFEWNFGTNETSLAADPWRGSFIDYTFFSINGQLTKVADINSANTDSPSIFDKETGTQIYQHTFNNTGTYTVAFGLVDIDDYNVTSALSIKNINLERIQSVPEPVSQPITILGTSILLGFSALYKKKIR